MKSPEFEILKSLTVIPTVPFREEAVQRYIRQFARTKGLVVKEDDMGNILLMNPKATAGKSLVFAAHMDHPGFLIEKPVGQNGGTTTARFYGGVGDQYFQDANVRIVHEGRLASRGCVEKAAGRGRGGFRRVTLRLEGPAESGDKAVWDLPNYRLRGHRFYARACDDLAGCAAILAVLAEALRKNLDLPLAGLFTVAEEAGFHGALHVCRKAFVPTPCSVVSVETSSEMAGPLRGGGVVVRVGDRQSIFDPAMTTVLLKAAKKADVKVQRALMDGGTCEGSAYQLYGYRTGALALPLGNYHNQNTRRRRIGMESIDLGDLKGAVELMLRASEFHSCLDEWQKMAVPEYRDRHGRLGEWKLEKVQTGKK